MVATSGPEAVPATDGKLAELRAAVDDMKLRTGRSGGDTVRQVVGGVLMLGGFVAGLVVYEQSLSESSTLNLRSEQIFALAMVGVVAIGAALYVSASISRFLRFWMLRHLYAGRANIDRLVDAIPGPPQARPVRPARAVR